MKQQQARETSIVAINNRLSDIDVAPWDLRARCGKINTPELSMQSMERILASYEIWISWFEIQSRRSNLVIFGISLSPCETEAALGAKVILNVFEKKLGV